MRSGLGCDSRQRVKAHHCRFFLRVALGCVFAIAETDVVSFRFADVKLPRSPVRTI